MKNLLEVRLRVLEEHDHSQLQMLVTLFEWFRDDLSLRERVWNLLRQSEQGQTSDVGNSLTAPEKDLFQFLCETEGARKTFRKLLKLAEESVFDERI